MNWRQRIVVDPAIHHGEPWIKEMRVPVSVIVGSIANGDTVEKIIDARPQLTSDDIQAALNLRPKKVASTLVYSFVPGLGPGIHEERRDVARGWPDQVRP